MSSPKVITPLSFLIGIGVGTAIGIMTAPHKGKVTRAKMKQKAEEAKEAGEEKMVMLQGKLREVKSSLA